MCSLFVQDELSQVRMILSEFKVSHFLPLYLNSEYLPRVKEVGGQGTGCWEVISLGR